MSEFYSYFLTCLLLIFYSSLSSVTVLITSVPYVDPRPPGEVLLVGKLVGYRYVPSQRKLPIPTCEEMWEGVELRQPGCCNIPGATPQVSKGT